VDPTEQDRREGVIDCGAVLQRIPQTPQDRRIQSGKFDCWRLFGDFGLQIRDGSRAKALVTFRHGAHLGF